MKIAVSGTSGLIGKALCSFLENQRHQIIRIVRSPDNANPTSVYWNTESGELESAKLEKLDALVHLAGENIASQRWTNRKKEKIRTSRVKGSYQLCQTLIRLENPPSAIIAASAVGYYGSRGREILDETAEPGKGFLAQVCRDWELSWVPAKKREIRLVHLRLGMVLSPSGGALAKMLPAFKWGAGGKLGSGEQYISWCSILDVLRAIDYCLSNDSISGQVNLVSPEPVSNAQFTKTLGEILRVPTVIKVPEIALRALFGEMAESLLLSSVRATPKRLIDSGFIFEHHTLEQALSAAILKTRNN